MADLFAYLLWRDDLSFAQDPLNEVDMMILTRFSYLPFEHLRERISLSGIAVRDACAALLEVPDMEKQVLLKDDFRLMQALKTSSRLGSMLLTDYENLVEPESQTQFSAITVEQGDLHLILFRGTDDTLVGWKENFNMAFVSPVPAQLLAVTYTERIAAAISGPLILGGHSKGGNLAVYAASFCSPETRKRIRVTYNFDGPGFADSVLENPAYQQTCQQVKTYVPQGSVVGMLLGHGEKHTVVHSTRRIHLLQHDVYSWDVQKNKFVYEDAMAEASRVIDATVKSWFAVLDSRQREQFINVTYEILTETKADSLRELGENWLGSTLAVAKAIRNLDDKTRKAVLETMAQMLRCTGGELSEAIRSRTQLPGRDRPQD